ncbi:RDD family protein [Flaviaesturariibacter flavus]|uniref:RDD family protein n=1 Tax=Flaviaesturariibacter flavus TaxID=2502780 RepID=A0A4R1BAV6_9BACT|nr:RDD family protein [Flaviaesturariibacter flavus]TCJ14111.1 RDD family protein [Flaviaesturariibacter flavus]
MEQYEERQEDLFTNMEPVLVQADAGKRLVNYIVDQVAFIAFAAMLGLVAGVAGGDAAIEFVKRIEANFILNYLTSQLLYAFFMGSQEALFRGKTFGKMITGTRAVSRDGAPLSTDQAFTRGICRAIPLNTLSALFSTPPLPWHDQLSRTVVIDEKASHFPGS